MPQSALVADLAAQLTPRAAVGPRCGIEHEYTVLGPTGAVDFGRLLDRLHLGGLRIDPGDPNARRLPWGGVVTVDGREAEVVTPPVPLGTEAVTLAARLTSRGRVTLDRALRSHDPLLEAVGYSTHLNVSVDDNVVVRAGRGLVRHFGLPLMLLLDRLDSPGILVRPRRGRLELAGEYATGDQLRTALTFFVAACRVTATGTRAATRGLGAPRPVVVAADQRYGWYIDRRAYGVDLYAGGRDSTIPVGVRGSRRLRAGDVLEAAWALVRGAAATWASPADVALVDAVVDGRAPIPLEAPSPPDVPAWLPSAHGSLVRPRRRSVGEVRAEHATWEATLFRVSPAHAPERYVNVPDRHLERFLTLLDNGELDAVLAAIVAAPTVGTTFRLESEAGEVGIYDRVADPSALNPTERDVATGRIGGGGRGGREHKHDQGARPHPRFTPLRVAVLVGGAVAATATIAAIALAAGGGGSSKAAPPATPSTTQAPIPVTATFAVTAGPVRTLRTTGLFVGHPAVVAGGVVTYSPIDADTPKAQNAPSGTVSYTCAGNHCINGQGFTIASEFTITGRRATGVGPGALSEVTDCNIPVPPESGVTGMPVRFDVTRDSRTRQITRMRMDVLYVWDRTTNGTSNDKCANVLVASVVENLRRIS